MPRLLKAEQPACAVWVTSLILQRSPTVHLTAVPLVLSLVSLLVWVWKGWSYYYILSQRGGSLVRSTKRTSSWRAIQTPGEFYQQAAVSPQASSRLNRGHPSRRRLLSFIWENSTFNLKKAFSFHFSLCKAFIIIKVKVAYIWNIIFLTHIDAWGGGQDKWTGEQRGREMWQEMRQRAGYSYWGWEDMKRWKYAQGASV